MSPSLFPAHVESDRLRYDPLHETVETLDLYELHRSGELEPVMRPLGDDPHGTPKETFDELTTAEEKWQAGELASYAITERESGAFVGLAELDTEWDRDWAGFGIWLREPYWGRGYAGERAGAMLYVAFELLDLEIVSVGHEPENERSKRAIRKYVDRYGGQADGILRNGLPPGEDGGPRDLEIYTISQAQWREHVADDELETIRVER